MIPKPTDTYRVYRGRVDVPLDEGRECGLFDTDRDFGRKGAAWSRRINFPAPFFNPPVVMVALAKLDSSTDRTTRVNTKATDIDAAGFTIRVSRWRVSKLYAVSVEWLAMPGENVAI